MVEMQVFKKNINLFAQAEDVPATSVDTAEDVDNHVPEGMYTYGDIFL